MIADISLQGMSGLELIKEVRRIRPTLPTLVLSMHPAAQFARRALSAGAIGYLTKGSELEEFVTAIEQVRRGRRYISRDAADLLVRRSVNWEAAPHETCRIVSIRCCAARVGKNDFRHRPRSRAQRENRQHLPRARARQTRHA